jgi:hypothetical protein
MVHLVWFPVSLPCNVVSMHTRAPVQQGIFSDQLEHNIPAVIEPHEFRIDWAVETDCLYDEHHSNISGMQNRSLNTIPFAPISDASLMNGQKLANFLVVLLSYCDSFIIA